MSLPGFYAKCQLGRPSSEFKSLIHENGIDDIWNVGTHYVVVQTHGCDNVCRSCNECLNNDPDNMFACYNRCMRCWTCDPAMHEGFHNME